MLAWTSRVQALRTVRRDRPQLGRDQSAAIPAVAAGGSLITIAPAGTDQDGSLPACRSVGRIRGHAASKECSRSTRELVDVRRRNGHPILQPKPATMRSRKSVRFVAIEQRHAEVGTISARSPTPVRRRRSRDR